MESLVTIRQLEPEQAMLAFPLVREAEIGVTLESWQDTARKLTCTSSGRAGGIVVAERNGFPRGLFTYEVTKIETPKRRLLVRNLVVMELVRREAAAGVLFSRMAELAHDLSCVEVHVDVPKVSAWIRKQWDELVAPELGVPFTCSE
jgi:hypothetical protein